ncbi:hypothetical protein [Actinoallomurus acanthiterrae]
MASTTFPFPDLLAHAQALVIPIAAAPDAAHVAHTLLDWLAAGGNERLAASSVLLVHELGRGAARLTAGMDEVAGRVRAMHSIPWDPRLQRDVPVDLARLRRNTRRAYLNATWDIAGALLSAPLADVNSSVERTP